MKKYLLFSIFMVAILTLTGCSGTNEASIINRLSHQLDRTTSTVNSITSDTSSALALDNISKLFSENASMTQISTISQAYQNSSQNALALSETASKITKKIISIKKSIAGNIKLGNQNSSAINQLTSSMQKYTNSLNKTKSDYKNAAKQIYKFSDTENTNELTANLAKLSCCVESRKCYMDNLLLTLENIENILSVLETEQNLNDNLMGNTSSETTNVSNNENTTNTQNTTERIGQPQQMLYENEYYDDLSDKQNLQENIYNQNLQNQNYGTNYNNYRPAPNIQNYNQNFNQNYNGQYYGYNGYNNWRGGFNPDRNTDTYGPGVTNIDTYKFYGNNRRFQGSNGVNMIEADIQKQDDNVEQKTFRNEIPVEKKHRHFMSQSEANYINDEKTAIFLENKNGENFDNTNNTEKMTKKNLIEKQSEKQSDSLDNELDTTETNQNLNDSQTMLNQFDNIEINQLEYCEDLTNCPVNDSNTNEKQNGINSKIYNEQSSASLENESAKIKSVSNDVVANQLNLNTKIKGHTRTQLDVNKKIEELIKKAV